MLSQVYGIDVGSGNGGRVFDGTTFRKLSPQSLALFLKEIGDNALVAWDAPLTGPTTIDGPLSEQDLTERPIETFFRGLKPQWSKWKPPKGVAVLGYAGLSHWTITRRLLGLPIVGPYDLASASPFKCCVTRRDLQDNIRRVVEVHPALAAWIWLRNNNLPPEAWLYKGKFPINDRKSRISNLWRSIQQVVPAARAIRIDPKNDDEFDAAIAWILAHLCNQGSSEVSLLGNRFTGALLLPADPQLSEDFATFVRSDRIAKRLPQMQHQ